MATQAGVPADPAARASRRKKRRPSTFWRIRDDIPRRLELTLLVLSVLTPLLVWLLLSVTHAVSPLALPTPMDTLRAGYDLLKSGDLTRDASASVQRVFIGFGIAILISVPLGLAMGTFQSIRALFEPMIGLIRYAPVTAFTLLLIIWLGLGEEPKIALVALGTVFFNTLMTANVVWQVPTELIKVSLTLGAGPGSVFRKVIFPYALPGMIDAMRVNLAAAWNLVVVAELIAAEDGLGRRIVSAQKFLRVDDIFVVIVVISVLGLTCDVGLRLLRNKLAPWSQE